MTTINVDQEAATRDAVYLSNGDSRAWILRKDIFIEDSEKEDGKFISVTIPKSLAIEKGLI